MVVRRMKEKCKDAARMRREKERAEFAELSKLLPLPASTTSQLDKASIIRLTSSYLRMRSAFPQGLGGNWGHEKEAAGAKETVIRCPSDRPSAQQPVYNQTLDGFVFALHRDGKIMYISETASVHLGLPQIDLTGSSVFEYVHPSDHNDIYAMLGLSEEDKLNLDLASNQNPASTSLEMGRSFCMRMKCILPKRNAGLVSSGYKTIHCNGYLKVRCRVHQAVNSSASNQHEWESYALVAVGHSLLPSASTEVKLTGNSFMFRANLDLKIYHIEPSALKALGFEQIEMVGRSLYQFVHAADILSLESSHRTLLDKGQAVTRYFRLMKRDGGFIWIQSCASLVNNPRNMPKPQHIVGICYMLADDSLDSSAMCNNNSDPISFARIRSPSLLTEPEALPSGDSSPDQRSQFHQSSAIDFIKPATQIIARTEGPQIKRMRQRLKVNQIMATNVGSSMEQTADICSKCNETLGSCDCLNGSSIGVIESQPAPIGPLRRTSDDSCSVVSSVASASISSVASCSSLQLSHGSFDFMGPYCSIDQTAQKINLEPMTQINCELTMDTRGYSTGQSNACSIYTETNQMLVNSQPSINHDSMPLQVIDSLSIPHVAWPTNCGSTNYSHQDSSMMDGREPALEEYGFSGYSKKCQSSPEQSSNHLPSENWIQQASYVRSSDRFSIEQHDHYQIAQPLYEQAPTLYRHHQSPMVDHDHHHLTSYY